MGDCVKSLAEVKVEYFSSPRPGCRMLRVAPRFLLKHDFLLTVCCFA